MAAILTIFIVLYFSLSQLEAGEFFLEALFCLIVFIFFNPSFVHRINAYNCKTAGMVSVENSRPPFSTGTPELIEMLIDRCWRENPDERLSFKQIGIELKEIHKALSEREKTWLSASFGHPVYEEPSTLRVPDHARKGEFARARSLTRHPVFEKPRRGLLPRSKSKSPTPKKRDKMGLLSLFNKKK